MLLVPKAFRKYVSGRPFPLVVQINYRAGYIWPVHAHPFDTDTDVKSRDRRYQKAKENPMQPIVHDNGWYDLADFLGLKVSD
jgi:hypothetical protein